MNTPSSINPETGRYTIAIPSYWTKNDLLDLRDFLEKATIGLVPVWINIGGKEKDTKFTIEDVKGLEAWVEKQ